MQDVILSVLGPGSEEIVASVSGAMVLVLTVVFIDFIKDIFSGFFRG